MYEIETDAFEKAIAESSQEGPLFILVEIDTPGGRIDLAQRMCTAITKNADCNVIAFIKGGQNGGAISAGAAIALSCSKIYMTDNTVIGAATLVTMPKDKKDYENTRKKNYGEVVDEKMSSAWRAYLASLAQQNDRPGLLARAMVDRDIAVVEVNQAGKRLFIEPVNKRPEQQVARTWNKAGSLVTLTAREAVECTIADGLVDSREQLLQQLQAGDANVVTDKKIANARKELQIAQRKMDEALKSFDMKVQQSKYPQLCPNLCGHGVPSHRPCAFSAAVSPGACPGSEPGWQFQVEHRCCGLGKPGLRSGRGTHRRRFEAGRLALPRRGGTPGNI